MNGAITMAFQLDHDNIFELNVPDGEYEVFINSVGENVTQNGSEYIQVDLIIRNDVSQPSRNGHIFHKIWRTKATGEYNPKNFNIIGKAAELPNKKSYHSMEELFDDLRGRPVRVKVKNEKSEYNGKEYENLNVKAWEKTKIDGPIRHVKKEQQQQTQQQTQRAGNDGFFGGSQITIRDEDLPF
jgi:Protein of unknown function (DUF669)